MSESFRQLFGILPVAAKQRCDSNKVTIRQHSCTDRRTRDDFVRGMVVTELIPMTGLIVLTVDQIKIARTSTSLSPTTMDAESFEVARGLLHLQPQSFTSLAATHLQRMAEAGVATYEETIRSFVTWIAGLAGMLELTRRDDVGLLSTHEVTPSSSQ